ncbi:MAG TPA: hypothetical protein VFT29_16295 [Gemmatimonadaceae bacterium]|nr:hypothetical protein [Gemmatimonadaceae bacterium]
MPSLADRGRNSRGSGLELALRIAAFVALAGWIANAARPAVSRRETVRGASLTAALPRWTHGRVDSVRVQLDTVPDPASLAWLAALRGAGVGVTWSGATISDVALETYVPTDPTGGVVALVASREAEPRVVSDALGPVDTLRNGVSIIRLASVEGGLTVTSGNQAARAQAAAVAAPRRILVAGAAGWEPKFIIAALEERGWQVDAHLSVAPDREVTQGGALAGLDTARYSAVVLLDSASAENARGVEPFVRSGGGVVLAGDANLAARVAGLVAWRAGKRATAPLGTLAGDTTWRGLSLLSLQLLPDRRAIVLEQHNGQPVVTARRHYAGRVIGVGYDQTWRWRMAGDDSRIAHRDYWSRVVSSVALRPASATSDVRTGAAPRAELYEALGPPSAAGRALAVNFSPSAVSGALGLVILLSLLSEWLLRRSRGAR